MTPSRAVRDLTPEQNEQARAMLVDLLQHRWSNNKTRAAEELGVDQSTVSKIVSGATGASLRLAGRIYQLAGRDPIELLGLTRSVDAEAESPALRSLRERAETKAWRAETWGAIEGAATASKDPMTEADLYGLGLVIEAQIRGKAFAATVVESDPIEDRRRARKKG